ncbi:MAG: hypothetical protein O2930_14225 [Acidobacteria bacterium]|nr:hypothetical protein [Acidobacteriota bacterium]
MTDVADTPLPSQLWKQLSAERRLAAAEAFWRDAHAVAEQGELLGTIAQRIKFRIKSVVAMPVEKKARQVVALPTVSEAVAARLLVVYHVAHQRPMMGRFLDALEIPHEDGMIADEELAAPPPQERLAAAAKTLASAFPAEDVSLYLSTLIWQDPETWGGLAGLPQVNTQT